MTNPTTDNVLLLADSDTTGGAHTRGSFKNFCGNFQVALLIHPCFSAEPDCTFQTEMLECPFWPSQGGVPATSRGVQVHQGIVSLERAEL